MHEKDCNCAYCGLPAPAKPAYNVADTIALLNSRMKAADRAFRAAEMSTPKDDCEYRGSNEAMFRGGGVNVAKNIKLHLERTIELLASALEVVL